jgi:phosphatidylglycerophosphate synthase
LSPGFETHSGARVAKAAADQAQTELNGTTHPVAEAKAGLVFATGNHGSGPISAISSGGIAIIRRQIRQLKSLGAGRIIVACKGDQEAALDHASREAQKCGLALQIAETPDALQALAGSDQVMAIDEGLLVDERLLAAFFGERGAHEVSSRPVIGAFDAEGRNPAGLLLIPPGLCDDALSADLFEGWARGRKVGAIAIRDLSGLDDYAPARRRRLPMVWLRIGSPADGRKGTSVLLESAQKGCLDWPARFIHPPVENLLTRLLLPTPITPNMISLGVFLMGLFAAWDFATGSWVRGLVLALLIGPLDGVDGKLARTRLEFSRWGDLEHVGDKIVEYLFYICMAVWIGAAWAWPVAALAVLFAFAEAIQGEFYRRFTGGQLDDAGAIERGFRLVSGRRNTFMWCLIPFVAFGAWQAGFILIAAYSVLTFFFMQWRFYVRIGEYGRANSPAIDGNMRLTAYAFLKKGK